MGATRTDSTARVRAAQAGDRAALDELVTAHLPLVHTIVRQALGDHPDADDVTQDVMVRALRQLRSLRSPESFRPWLAAIALHQVSTHRHRAGRAAAQTAPLDEATGLADDAARVEDVTHLRMELSGQRRQVQRAAAWLDPDDRAVSSLWWLELAGRLTRAELAESLGITVAHAGVRVQRMHERLDLSRAVVAALDARPACPVLRDEIAGWDGTPRPRWRKRLARHVRACPVCGRAAGALLPAERLLPGLALFPVPAALTAAVLTRNAGEGTVTAVALSGSAAAGKAGLLGQVASLAAAHPVIAAVAAATLAVGATAGAITLSTPQASTPVAARPAATGATTSPARPAAGPGPSAADAGPGPSADAGPLRAGRASLESVNAAGRFVTASGNLGMLTAVGPGNTVTARRQATFQVVAGLADPGCFSLRVADGRYLRHESWRVRADEDAGTALFRGDATFCPAPGEAPGSVTLEASNYPGRFLRHRGDELWVDQADQTAGFRVDASFTVRPPLGDF
jgi:RNA polymerase sigma factor (sigma-70 family)